MKNYKRFLILILSLDMCLICAGLVKFNKESYVEASEISKSVAVSKQDEEIWVVPSGEPIGIYVKSEGVMVIGIGEIKAADGQSYSPCSDIIAAGDYILSVEGELIEDKLGLTKLVNQCEGKEIQMTVQKKGDNSDNIIIETVTVKPVQNENGDYMLGLWVKDDISGIGTLTYYDENSFGALGHSINDNDTGELFEISDGAIYKASLINIVKSNRKLPGRLEGMIDYSSSNMLGRVEENSAYGINGYITNSGRANLSYDEYMPVGYRSEIEVGEAYLLSSLSGEPEYYSVEITDVIYDTTEENKEIQLRITDSRLVELTSGIVQGMSGTPIIQNGKLIGAVTHVLVNDPTKGYGVFIEEMLE
ncbi:MAG: SpoIVB peptidase [Lachnospiraceae bacterium]|nr:SpoIVB peptidase [Lachnospiraceae bacterium]